jgi:oxygen-independent coproporphyrinogen-3 oxidase
VPFCGQKCTYCNFATGVFPASIFPSYVDAVCREIEMRRGTFAAPAPKIHVESPDLLGGELGPGRGAQQIPRLTAQKARLAGDDLGLESGKNNQAPSGEAEVVDTVYVGGGTPSLLAPGDLGRLLEALRVNFDCQFREVTLEADPETITAENSAAWREGGYDRVSLGVQSFADAELVATGRRHRRGEILKAVESLRRAGFANISIDLIAGLPCQTEESWRQSLAELLAIAPEHVSIYLLESDEGSALGREMLHGGVRFSARRVPSDDEMVSFYEYACETLERAGYEHYEISNWARRTVNGDGELRSHHNLKYWRREPYLGFGAGAHSFDGAVRQSNTESVTEYLAGMQHGKLPVKEREVVGTQQALDEELFLGLRQIAGIDFGQIEKAYGVSLRERVASLAAAGFIEMEGTRARLAPGKLALANEVFVELMGQTVS